MQQNPIRRIREELGVTNLELAEKLGVSIAWLHKMLMGYPQKLSPQIRRALKRLGYDADEISREYVAWRRQKLEELEQRSPQGNAAAEAALATEPEPRIAEVPRPVKPTFKRLRNLTTHPIYIYVDGFEAPITIPPDPQGPARVMVRHVRVAEIAGVPVWRTEPVSVVGLPDPDPDVGLIVSKVVADTMRGTRYDLLVPDVLIRDKDGRIQGARGLSWIA